jgi:tetratricopeptide (TPR) repeat protein
MSVVGGIFLIAFSPVHEQQAQNAAENEKKRAFNDGNNFIKLGRYDEALIAYDKAINLDSTWGKAYYGKALALKGSRRYSEAVQAYQIAIRRDPNFGEAYFALGILYSEIEQHDKAIVVLRQATEHLHASPTGAAYKAFYALGLAYDKMNQFKEAVNALRRAQELNAKYFWAFYMLGNVLNKLGQYDEALAEIEGALALKENLHLALALQAEIYNAKNQPELALKAAQASLQASAGYPRANFEAGRALKLLRRFDEATTYFRAAGKDRAWQKNVEYEIEDIKRLQQN